MPEDVMADFVPASENAPGQRPQRREQDRRPLVFYVKPFHTEINELNFNFQPVTQVEDANRAFQIQTCFSPDFD
jgi:hypothetical protein